jgi:hypothetical protein
MMIERWVRSGQRRNPGWKSTVSVAERCTEGDTMIKDMIIGRPGLIPVAAQGTIAMLVR